MDILRVGSEANSSSSKGATLPWYEAAVSLFHDLWADGGSFGNNV